MSKGDHKFGSPFLMGSLVLRTRAPKTLSFARPFSRLSNSSANREQKLSLLRFCRGAALNGALLIAQISLGYAARHTSANPKQV